MDFDLIWRKILACEGEVFETKTGIRFTYQIIKNQVVPDRTNYPLAKSNFEKAMAYMPMEGPGVIGNLVRGSAYVYAILMDDRIRT